MEASYAHRVLLVGEFNDLRAEWRRSGSDKNLDVSGITDSGFLVKSGSLGSELAQALPLAAEAACAVHETERVIDRQRG